MLISNKRKKLLLLLCCGHFFMGCDTDLYVPSDPIRIYSFMVDGRLVKYGYYNIIPSFSRLYDSKYSFDKETFQGGAIFNNTLFLTRHNGVIDVVDVNNGKLLFINEFFVPFLSETKAHMNSASFGALFPVNNEDYPYLYVDRCSYYFQVPAISDAERNCCYVLSISNHSAEVVQTISFANDSHNYFDGKYGGAQEWSVDKFRDRLLCIGYAMQGDERVFLIKEFELPEVGDPTIELHDSDVIKQWSVSDKYNGIQHACQAVSITEDYIIIPVSRGDSGYESEAIRVFSADTNKELFVIELVESEVGEVQNVQEYNGDFYVVSKNGRIDKLVRIYEED